MWLCASLLYPSSCMLVSHWPSQQTCKEEYEPCTLGAAVTYYASLRKTLLPASLFPGPTGYQTTRQPPDRREETPTAVVCTCLPFIRSGQTHLVRHCERGKKTRQTKKRRKDNIRQWTGLEFAKSQRAVENREKWRKLVVKSSLVSHWPSLLRDRLRWRRTKR